MKNKVLYIEDEPFLGKIVKETLERQGFEVCWITDGAKVIESFESFIPDACVVDIMLPNIDGYTLCREIRGRFPVLPILFLTAKTETADLVKGFDAGGTDYIRKPFSIEELIARINSQIQVVSAKPVNIDMGQKEHMIGKYRFVPRRCELHAPSGIIKLSMRDMQVFQQLVKQPNQIVDRKELLLTVWGDDSFFNSRNLDVYIRKIRSYLSEDPNIEIVTMKGKGYLFLIK